MDRVRFEDWVFAPTLETKMTDVGEKPGVTPVGAATIVEPPRVDVQARLNAAVNPLEMLFRSMVTV